MLTGWLLVLLAYGWSSFLIALGIYALAMRGHSSRAAAIIIKIMGAVALLWGIWVGFATSYTLWRGLA